MFYLSKSSDGKKFHSVFVYGRLRTYSCLKNAINGASHLIKSPKQDAKVIRVYSKSDNSIIATLTKTPEGQYTTEYHYPEASPNNLSERLEWLKERHKLWKEKKNTEQIDQESAHSILASLIKTAIDNSDIPSLYNLEQLLFQKGLSWVPFDNGVKVIAISKIKRS